MMAIEVFSHHRELWLEAKVCCFCQEFFISVFFNFMVLFNCLISFLLVFFFASGF
jgi:hypothetical protein